jgi:GNAT superfamily N-acetyltransferase
MIRPITVRDIDLVAFVHSTSWRSSYRSMLRDDFLDSDLEANRRILWAKRLLERPANHFGFIALDNDSPVGFAFAFGDEDPRWGTQLDNLHVLPNQKGKGLGKALLKSVCCMCMQANYSARLFLWVYEANASAQAFYARLGAKRGERKVIQAPGGGEVAELRFSWSSVEILAAKLSQ